MSRETYNQSMITQYLLGSLSEAETERLDELSLTDDGFAALLESAEKDLVDAYIQGELTGETLAQFKSHYLDSATRRERVEFAEALKEFWEGKNTPQTGAEVSSRWSVISLFTVPRASWQWGLVAATLVLLTVVGWLAFDNVRLRRQISIEEAHNQTQLRNEQEIQSEFEKQRAANAAAAEELSRAGTEREHLEQELKKEQEKPRTPEQQRVSNESPGNVNIASFILSPQMRAIGEPPTITIPPQTKYVSMQLRLEPDDHSEYQAEIINPVRNQTLWRSAKLKARGPKDGQTLSVTFPGSLLTQQAYAVRVTGISSNGVSELLSDYPFRVVK